MISDLSRSDLSDPDGHALDLESVPRHYLALAGDCDAAVGFNSRDERSRPFNLLRGQLRRRAEKRELRVVAVTSATPRVGKSFVAINLAAALSRATDLKSYLFDFDLRRSSVAEYLQIPVSTGLTEYLDGREPDLNNAAWAIEGEALTVFPTASQRVRSAELLTGKRADQLFAAMRQIPAPAICVCDFPPVFANDDAVILSRHIDGYILVIQDGLTTAKQVRNAIRMMRPAVCLGTVLNRFQGGFNGDDYGYGYGSRKQYSDYYG